MGKILKGIAIAVAVIGLAIITGGISLPSTITTAIGGSVVATATLAGSVSAFGSALIAIAASAVLSGISQQFFGPKTPKTQLTRLNTTLDPSTPRKAVFGTTAMNLDVRYIEASGTDQEYFDYIIACAAHKVTSIDEIWFEDKLAWSTSGGVTSTYTGYLTVATVTEGTPANTIAINGGSKWGSTRRLTGCAYIHIRIKRTGATNKVESPLVGGLPSRITVRGNGALLYDPRKDSTVTGGSGSHRANDQTTWGSYTSADDTDNPALQLLWWLIGWKINDKLSVGCGVPVARIDLASFVTAANVCDENITLSIGGTQKKYRCSGTASDADDRMEIINTFLACMNGTLRDSSGKLSLIAMKNDLGDYVLTFTDDDVLEAFNWNQTRGITDTYNKARGRYVDPSDSSLYQMVEYPAIGITSIDGIERVVTIDLPFVEDGRRAQRIAKQVLQRNQYRGMFSATFSTKALGCEVGDVVRITFTPLGWTNKLFRITSQEIRFDGRVPLTMIEENAAIYAWDSDESAPVVAVAPTTYDPLNNPFILGILDAGIAYQIEPSVNQVLDNVGSFTPSTITFSTYIKAGASVRSAYSGRMVIATSADGISYTDRYTSSADESSKVYTVPTGVGTIKFIRARMYEAGGTTNQLDQTSVGAVKAGVTGANGITISLSATAAQLFAYANGTVPSFAAAAGVLTVWDGSTDVTASCTLSTSNTNITGTINTAANTPVAAQPVGYYRVTAMSANTGFMKFTITYASVVYYATFSVAKLLTGYEIVGALPSSNLFEGRMVYLTTDDKLYRYTGSAWVTAVAAVDITGQITSTQITDLAISTGKLAANAVTAAKITAGTITATELATDSVTANKILAGAVTAAKISVTSLDAMTATIGTLRTATTGARMEIRDNVIKIYDSSNVLRIKMGDLSL